MDVILLQLDLKFLQTIVRCFFTLTKECNTLTIGCQILTKDYPPKGTSPKGPICLSALFSLSYFVGKFVPPYGASFFIFYCVGGGCGGGGGGYLPLNFRYPKMSLDHILFFKCL